MSCEKRLVYIDIIKIISILGVILIHVSAEYWYAIPVASNRYEAMNLWNAIGRFGVACFIMCSGVLLLKKDELSYKDLLKKYIWRLGLAFIIWSFIYALVNADYNIMQVFVLLKKGIPRAHLWYLIMIIGMYLILPIIRIFIKNARKKDVEYFLVLAFIIQFLIPLLTEFEIFKWINNYYKQLNPTIITGYVGYLVLGYYLDKYELGEKQKNSFIILGIISIIITIFLNLFKARELSKPTTTFFNNLYANVAMYSMAIFILVKKICEKIKFNKVVSNYIKTIGNLVFGVYLIHMLLKDILNCLNVNSLMTNTYIAIPITTITIFLSSLGIVYIISKIPYLRKSIL